MESWTLSYSPNISTHATDRQSAPVTPAMPAAGTGIATPPKFDFWRTAHRALRGQYRLAAILAASGALVGAAIGSQLGQRLYSSTGLVRIASVLPQVMHETDQNRPMAMFDGFIAAQREVMLSRDVIQAAMQEETWRRAERTGRAPADIQFAAMLKVETHPRSDHMKITFTDKDPGIAAAAVRSVIAAYQRTYVSEQDRVESQRVEELKNRHATLSAQLQKLEADLGPNTTGHNPAELEPAYNAAADCQKKLRAALVEVQCAIAGVPDLTARQTAPDRSPSEVAADDLLHIYVQAQAKAEGDLESARRSGLGAGHPRIVALENAVVDARLQLERHLGEYEALRSSRPTGPTPVSLAERETNLRSLIDSTELEMKKIAERRAQLAVFEQQSASIKQDLKETDDRLDSLATEASLGSRLTVVNSGDKPMSPSLDNRTKVAGLGGLVGLGIPLSLMILRGNIRRRYRHGDELADDLRSRVPFVALLPEVVKDGPLNTAASRCIHELRSLLQPRNQKDSRTYLVTSVAPNEGTTSVAMSLALSYAAAGCRTLLVDCNLTSRRLTREFGAESSVGMLEALAGDDPSVHDVRAGMFFLAAGHGPTHVSLELTTAEVGRVLGELRGKFDVVLIDGEPIITGATASVLVPKVDGVLLTVAHGQEQSLIEKAVKQTQALGGIIAGVVFNRAADTDFPAAMREQPTNSPELPAKLTRFGALVCTVMSSLSLCRENDLDLIPVESVTKRSTARAA
jgi:succinoglycan biosynthesis transport protein ExoP